MGKGKGKKKNKGKEKEVQKEKENLPTNENLEEIKNPPEQKKNLQKEIVNKESAFSEDEEDTNKDKLKCEKCNSEFPSKNKLFNHLKSMGHAVYLGQIKDKGKPAEKKLTKKQKKRL